MRILIYGAGVLGSLYAAKLKTAGNDVAILARGKRLEEIKTNGLVLEDAANKKQSKTEIDVVETLNPNDKYDLVLVLIPKHQVDAVLPSLSANKTSSLIVFILNNPSGFDAWAAAVGSDRFLVGFPGAGGKRESEFVRYRLLPKLAQPTTLGEPDGSISERTRSLAGLLKKAGFPTALCGNMDAWLKYHVAWTSPMMTAICMAGGDGPSLAARPETIRLMIEAIRENFAVLKALNLPVTPWNLSLNWELFPISSMLLSTPLLFRSKLFADVAGGHAQAALPEFKVLSKEFQALARSTNVATPASNKLNNYIATLN